MTDSESLYGGWLPNEPLISDLDGEPPQVKRRYPKRQRLVAKRHEKRFGWLSREKDLLAMQRWRDEVRLAVERHRAVGELGGGGELDEVRMVETVDTTSA